MRDLLRIRPSVVEGDPDLVLRRAPEADDPVHSLEDRTYPRGGASGGAARYRQFKRLFRRQKWPGQHEDQHDAGKRAEDFFPVRHCAPPYEFRPTP